ncbi:uncharacterized protein METZ01_LOCUS246946 [marine metagenome]|uniref:Uncharacterized protein n=1 Tax=marine metagenome TaxID=408172 RepID=A0A382I447_9ZZZZ
MANQSYTCRVNNCGLGIVHLPVPTRAEAPIVKHTSSIH